MDSPVKLGQNVVVDDKETSQSGLSRWLYVAQKKVMHFLPYGTFGRPISGTQQLILSVDESKSKKIAISGTTSSRIKKNCLQGEYGTGNVLTKANTYYKANGDVSIEAGKNPEGEEGKIDISSGKISMLLLPDGTLKIEGAEGELLSIISEWMQNMIEAKVVTGIGLMPLDPATISNLQITKDKFDSFKE